MFVHEVIAATVTAPCLRLNFWPSYSTGMPSLSASGLANVVAKSFVQFVFMSF